MFPRAQADEMGVRGVRPSGICVDSSTTGVPKEWTDALDCTFRHRYRRLASPEVATAIEMLGALGSVRPPAPTLRALRANAALREARTCYHHLAGRLGVRLAAGLESAGLVPDWWRTTAG